MRLSSALRLQEFWIGTTLAALTLLLVIANMVLSSANRRLQADVAGRQQYIQQSVPLETLYRAIVNDLGALATRNRDDQLTAMLAAHGIIVTPSPAPAGKSVAKP